MAQPIERAVVRDILAENPNANASAPQLGQMSVSNPRQTGGTDWMDGQLAIQGAVSKIVSGLAQKADQAKDDQRTEGRLQYMQGATEAEIAASGDKYTMQGWQAMESATSANDFVLAESLRIAEEDYQMDPQTYRKAMLERRAEKLKGLDKDPVSRKMWVDQFDNTAGKLIAEQTIKYNEYNKGKTEEAFSNQLITTSKADPNTGRVMPGSTLRVSPGVVSAPIKVSAYDRDAGIRTMLGEAANEGEQGMAAVAHVLKNRTARKGFGGSTIAAVALEPNQFSTWNPEINTATKFVKGSPAYERAGRVFDAVMSGHHADPTGGADHYYSPSGMDAYRAAGIKTSGDVPKWARGQKLSAKLGGHLFFNLASSGVIPAERDDRAQGDILLPPISDPSDVSNLVNRDDRQPTIQPSAQDILLNNPTIPARRKAELAGNIMIDQLKQGDDTAYEEMGGEASLRKLGLPETEIAKVSSAYNAYKAGRANDFNVAFEKQKNDVYQSVIKGERTAEEAGEWLEMMTQQNMLTDDAARSLQQSYFKAEREGDAAFIESPELQAELAQLQINLSARQGEEGFMTLEQGMAHAAKMAKKYNIPQKKMEAVTQSLVNEAKGRVEKERERVRAAGEKYKKNQLQARQANAALSAGYGLDSLSGSITTFLNDGTEKEITLKDYAIDQLKQSVLMQARSMMGRGGGPGSNDPMTGRPMSADDAATWANREIAAKLVRHGVVDPIQKQMVTAALTGSVIGTDGKVSEDSLQAMDYLMTLAADPRVGMEEAIKYVGNTKAAAMAATVMDLTATNVSLPDALHRANETLNGKSAAVTSPLDEVVARREISDKFDEIRNSITEDTTNSLRGWANYVFGTKTLNDDQYAAVEAQADSIKARVEAKTRAVKTVHPHMPTAAAVKLAIAQNANEAVVVGGQIVYGDPNKRQRLDQIMGLDGLRNAPDDAVKYWLEKHYTNILGQDEVGQAVLRNRETWWQKTKRVAGSVGDIAATAAETAARSVLVPGSTITSDAVGEVAESAKTLGGPPKLPYTTSVDERTGILTISYYDPMNDSKTVATRYAKLADIGAEYKKDFYAGSGLFGEAWLATANAGRSLRDAIVPGKLTSPTGGGGGWE